MTRAGPAVARPALTGAHETRDAMPPLDPAPPLSRFEFWPASLFYAPVWAWIVLLAIRHRGIRLPLVANPGLPASGLVGESKSAVLDTMVGCARAHVAPYVAAPKSSLAAALAALEAGGLDFPIVAKPDLGCRGAGVRPVRSAAELDAYLAGFPDGQTIVFQKLIDVEGEAGVFYVREPGRTRGEIFSLTLKYFPHVTGDGRRTLRQLILADPRAGQLAHLYLHRHARRLDAILPDGERVRLAFAGSHSRGAIFRDGGAHVTEALRARFDAIANGIPGFCFGRFDVRFGDFAAFRRGEGFAILEVNGAGAEATHIWDSRTRLRDAWRTLFRQFALLWRVGAANRARGHRPEPWRVFLRRWLDERRLVGVYPPTA
jgi:hypothetical protein